MAHFLQDLDDGLKPSTRTIPPKLQGDYKYKKIREGTVPPIGQWLPANTDPNQFNKKVAQQFKEFWEKKQV